VKSETEIETRRKTIMRVRELAPGGTIRGDILMTIGR